MKDTPLLFWVISGKNAWQAFFMLFLIFSGTSMALGLSSKPGTTLASMPWWIVAAFGVTVASTALLNLLSVYWPGKAETGIRVESWTAVVMALACYGFALLALHTPGVDQVSTVGLVALLGVFALGRWRQCRKAIREIAKFKRVLEGMSHE